MKTKERTKVTVKQHAATAKEKSKAIVANVMHEFKEGELHSGSKDGPIVTDSHQAIAIALSEADHAAKAKPPLPRKRARI